MRPVGSYGDLAQALADAAVHGPGTVRQLAERAQVGYQAAAYTASRMVQRGQLEVVSERRPAVLCIPERGNDEAAQSGTGMAALCAAWFGRQPDEALMCAWRDL